MADQSVQTPIGDQVAAEAEQPSIEPDHNAEIGDEPADTDGAFSATDGSQRPKYGHHDGRFYATFTVAANGPLSGQQLAGCAGNVRLHAVNNGYIATDTSHDVVTQTSEDGAVAQVIVSVPVRENTVAGQQADAEQADETPES
jgi:hypothetical protein